MTGATLLQRKSDVAFVSSSCACELHAVLTAHRRDDPHNNEQADKAADGCMAANKAVASKQPPSHQHQEV